MSGTLLCLGHGYCAQVLARRLLSRGWRVIGSTRDPERLPMLRADGIDPVVWPAEALAPLLDQATHVLVSIAPGPDGDPVLARHGEELAAARPKWLGYLSATSVYGDHAGAWVDEDTPATPGTARGRARLDAEQAWRSLALAVHVFRLAGIYGPRRNPFAALRDGSARRIVKPGHVFSRIHVDDVAQVLDASIQRPEPGAIYNVADDQPTPSDEVIEYAASLLGLPAPPAEHWNQAGMSAMQRSFYAESKRVRNDRLRRVLGVALAYPSYREGLAALLASEAS